MVGGSWSVVGQSVALVAGGGRRDKGQRGGEGLTGGWRGGANKCVRGAVFVWLWRSRRRSQNGTILYGNSEKKRGAPKNEGRFALLRGGQICPSSYRRNNSLTKKKRADLPAGREKGFPYYYNDTTLPLKHQLSR